MEAELERALLSLDGWAEQTLANERLRLDELKLAWRAQAARIRELSELLHDLKSGDVRGSVEDAVNERVTQSEQSRRENIERLARLRKQMQDDLLGTLAWVRELATMIHLAKYSGAPASRADELVSQIAAAVEGLSAVASWDEGERFPHDAATR
jgi:HAMP domain-containing protein